MAALIWKQSGNTRIREGRRRRRRRKRGESVTDEMMRAKRTYKRCTASIANPFGHRVSFLCAMGNPRAMWTAVCTA